MIELIRHVVELLRRALLEPDDSGQRVLDRDRIDVREQRRDGRGRLRVREDLDAVADVGRGHRLAVVPPRARIQRIRDRQRVGRPRPALGEPRRKSLVARRRQFLRDVGEVVEDQVDDRRADPLGDERRKDGRRVAGRREDEGASGRSPPDAPDLDPPSFDVHAAKRVSTRIARTRRGAGGRMSIRVRGAEKRKDTRDASVGGRRAKTITHSSPPRPRIVRILDDESRGTGTQLVVDFQAARLEGLRAP